MLSDEVLEKYHNAGRIAAKVRKAMKHIVREGMPLLQICEIAERMIGDLGGKPAFPCNVSVNEVAAHYTSPPGDPTTIPENSIVKIDIGVHMDGYIADTAVTVCFNREYGSLVTTSEKALEIAIKTIRAGIHTSELGSKIQDVIKSHGFIPISNLTGHKIGRFSIHTGESIPNIKHVSFSKITAGNVYAIEPFVTTRDAAGKVEDGPESYIYRLVGKKSQKKIHAKLLYKFLKSNFNTLPFAERWISEFGSSKIYKPMMTQLIISKFLTSYPTLVEVSRKPVAQSEHTVYISKSGPVVLT